MIAFFFQVERYNKGKVSAKKKLVKEAIKLSDDRADSHKIREIIDELLPPEESVKKKK